MRPTRLEMLEPASRLGHERSNYSRHEDHQHHGNYEIFSRLIGLLERGLGFEETVHS